MPTLKYLKLSILLVSALAVFAGCKQSKFRGDSRKKEEKPLCKEVKEIEGINVVFMIDNSNSNGITDCPNRTGAGSQNSTCGSQTNREKAVLDTYDFLTTFKPKDADSISEVAISSFPKEVESGFDIRSDGWLRIEGDQRASVEGAMAFTRKPFGATPYHAAILAGLEMYSQMKDSKKPRLAFLVTDGEPTDENPAEARDDAKKLRDMKVEIVTIFISGQQTREARQAQHIEWLKGEGQNRSEENINQLLGLNGEKSLIDAISDKKIEVAEASQLEAVFRNVIKEKVDCVE